MKLNVRRRIIARNQRVDSLPSVCQIAGTANALCVPACASASVWEGAVRGDVWPFPGHLVPVTTLVSMCEHFIGAPWPVVPTHQAPGETFSQRCSGTSAWAM